MKILVLASNPQGTEQLRLNQEIRQIEAALERGKKREQFIPRSKVAVRVEDLQRSLRQEAARIVHFCGHGTGSQGLVLETSSGQQQLLDTGAIADLFKLFANQVECVVLNACYSQVQAAEIGKHINYVIGTKREIRDDAAVAFSRGFYEALGDGETIEQAYKFGCNRIQLEIYDSSNPERKLVPVYSETENQWVELPQHQVIELLVKQPLNTIIDSSTSSSSDREAILQRPLITRSPYKGLKRFNAQDKDLFFGRDRLINELIEAVNQSNLVLVLGASGSGKSSVVRAGVIPKIEHLPETPYQYCLFTPDRDPFESFGNSLSNKEKNYDVSNSEIDFIRQGNSDTINQAINLLKSKHPHWLIFIDQFEELFTSCSNSQTRRNWIQGLVKIAQDTDTSVKVILAMRSDFLEELGAYPQFARIAQNNIKLVADMQVEELRQAIEQPAARNGVVFEVGLVEEIIRDVQGQAGSLPLLQYTLALLWQDDDLSDRTLNQETYRQLGGVSGALQQHVNQIYQELPSQQQLATKQILLRLVDVVRLEQSEILRTAVSRRAYKSEFTEAQAEIVDLLVNNSLLVSDDVTQAGQSTVEIAHEALLTSWAELKEWINDARNTISLNNRLAEDANRWQELKGSNLQQANEELWGGSKLEKVIELRNDGTFEAVLGGLSNTANEFVDASIDWRDRQIKEKLAAAEKLAEESEARRIAEQKAREEAENAKIAAEEKSSLEADANKKLRQRAWWLGILASVAVVFGISALFLRIKSQEAAKEAQLEQQAANLKVKLSVSNQIEHLLESIQLAGDNYNFNQTRWFKSDQTKLLPEVQSVLYQAVEDSRERHSFESHQGEVNSVAFSPDGGYIVSGSNDNSIKLWDIEQKQEIHSFEGHQDSVTSVAFSPDGGYIVSGSNDNSIKLWDIEQKQEIHSFEGHQDSVTSVAFSPDGGYIVSGGEDNSVRLWDIEQKQEIHSFNAHQIAVKSVAISPNGRYIVSGGGSFDYTVKLWDIQQQTLIHTFDGHEDNVNSVVLSPNGKYIISGSRDNTVKLWDIQQQTLIHTFDGHLDRVYSVAVSPDDKYIISGSWETMKFWDIQQRTLVHTFDGHESLVKSIAVSPNGKYIVSSSDDNTVKLWDIQQQTLIHTFDGHQDRVTSVAVSPNDKQIVSGSWDGTMKLWDIQQQAIVYTFDGHQGYVTSVAVSPNGKYIISGIWNGTVSLWDIQQQAIVYIFDDHESVVNSIAISPNGKYIVSGSWDGTVKLWDIQQQTLVHTFKSHKDRVISVAFSPDGQYIVSGSRDKTVKLWDIPSQTLVHTFNGHESYVYSTAISPNGKYIVSGSVDKTVKLWDIPSQTLVHTFNGHESLVTSVAVSLDGKYILSSSSNKNVKLWDIPSQTLVHTFNSHKDRVTSVAFSPNGKYIVSGSVDKTVKLWRGTDWQDWLAVDCQRVRLHPALVSLENEVAPKAANTCLKHGNWSDTAKAEFLTKQGLAFAEQGDLKAAKEKLQQADQLDNKINLAELETQAHQLAAQSLIEQGINEVQQGNVTEALSLFEQAHKTDPNLAIDAQSWNAICRFGSIYRHAKEVLDACEQAVELAPDEATKVGYLDSRGLARALTGNTEGAIEDFQAVVDEPESNEEDKQQRKQWIKSLQQGKNPFTDEVLEELKYN